MGSDCPGVHGLQNEGFPNWYPEMPILFRLRFFHEIGDSFPRKDYLFVFLLSPLVAGLANRNEPDWRIRSVGQAAMHRLHRADLVTDDNILWPKQLYEEVSTR